MTDRRKLFKGLNFKSLGETIGRKNLPAFGSFLKARLDAMRETYESLTMIIPLKVQCPKCRAIVIQLGERFVDRAAYGANTVIAPSMLGCGKVARKTLQVSFAGTFFVHKCKRKQK